VPKDVARALSDNPVTIPDVHSVYLGIDSLVMNIRPFDELNQFRTRCFISFASHQKRNLSLTQVLKLYVAAYQVGFHVTQLEQQQSWVCTPNRRFVFPISCLSRIFSLLSAYLTSLSNDSDVASLTAE
jgi:hypothetical protein